MFSIIIGTITHMHFIELMFCCMEMIYITRGVLQCQYVLSGTSVWRHRMENRIITNPMLLSDDVPVHNY